MYFVKTPGIIKPLSRDLLWSVNTKEKEAYLTFDDGPTPGVTEQVLDMLKDYDAKATFFCLGKNVEQYPALHQRTIDAGHRIGNHSYSHPDGWKTCTFQYARDVVKASASITSDLYRPPYGHITFSQASLLKKKFRLVMWDIISGDFDKEISKEKCLDNVVKNIQPGSIIVFHDSAKASHNMLFALPESLRMLRENGYTFKAIGEV